MPGVGRLNDKSIKELFFDLIVIIMSNISRFSQLRFCHIFQRLTKKLWNYLRNFQNKTPGYGWYGTGNGLILWTGVVLSSSPDFFMPTHEYFLPQIPVMNIVVLNFEPNACAV